MLRRRNNGNHQILGGRDRHRLSVMWLMGYPLYRPIQEERKEGEIMKILHICAENDKHQPYEVLACDPDPECLPIDYLPKGFHITETNTIELDEIDWPGFPTGSTFINESYI